VAAGNDQGLLEAGFCLGRIRDGMPPPHPVQSMQLGFERASSKREPLLPL
jgi:hypothetical protein